MVYVDVITNDIHPSFFIEREDETAMNEKKKKMMMQLSGVLVAVLVLSALVIPEKILNYVFVLAILTWLAAVFIYFKKDKEKNHHMQVINVEPDYKKMFAKQVYHRIQERMRCKFPGAMFQICDADLQKIAYTGKTVYVEVKRVENYTHMSVALSNDGELIMNLFSLVNLDNVQKSMIESIEEEDKEVEQWFTQKGQQLLTELLTNMNSRGYSKISINEDGDVMVREAGRNCVKDYFKDIPPKKDWPKLKELMANDGVDVQVSTRYLKFAW